MIEILEIEQRCKPSPLSVACSDDFAVLPAGLAEPDLLVRSPHISLYCLDDANRRALFVETPAEVDIAAYPFFFEAQYIHAQRLFAAPYATVVALAEALPAGQVPLVLIHSVGRSGSTLLSKAFQETGTITSLSEPDVYTQMVALRSQDSSRDADLTALLASATKLLFRPAYAGDAVLWVVKFRSFCIELADLLSVAFPQARSIFLTRDLRSWLQSVTRAFSGLSDTTALVTAFLPLVSLLRPVVEERGAGGVAPIEISTLLWLSTMHRYAALAREGFPLHTLRFEELVADPTRTMSILCRYVGIDERLAATAVRAFARDSQEGSVLARDAVSQRAAAAITDAEWAQVRALLHRFPLPTDASDTVSLAASAVL